MDVNDVLVFVRVVQAGSFSKAAKQLGMPVSTVSRRVADLEAKLGVPLLLRTTRSLNITDIGRAYFDHGKAIAAEMEKAEALASGLQSIPQGLLKITATTDFGNQFLGKIVCDFLKANPRVQVEVVLTERVVDLIAEGFDLAIRMGELDDSTYLTKKIGSQDMQLYASPSYLKSREEPKHPRDLTKFDCIPFTAQERANEWLLKSSKGEATVKVTGKASSNNMALVKEFALLGDGIALMPHYICADEVKKGRLKVILKEWASPAGAIHVVYPAQRFLLPKIRAFLNHLTKSCATVQWRI
jgi:DNA-binding transcriptional LysR family regulator